MTGLDLRFDGTTDEPPSEERERRQPDRYGDRWAPVLVAWATGREVPAVAGPRLGYGTTSWVDDGRPHLVTGQLVLDAEDLVGDDGALYSPRVSQRGTAKITHLATYPENPVRAGGNRVMYEVNGVAWDAFIGRIGVADLEDLSDDPPESETPTAPFFVY